MKLPQKTALLISTLGIFYSANAGLVGHWSFDGNYDDSSERNNHGTAGGNVIVGTDNGIFGGAASFDGAGDSVVLPIDESGSNWTVMAWSKAFNDGMFITSGGPEGWESLFIRYWADVTLHAAINWPEWNDSGTGWGNYGHLDVAPIEQGEWHHVAISFDQAAHETRGSARFYVDGELVHAVEASDPGPTFPGWANNQMTIGKSLATSKFDYAGLVDDVRLYDEALTAEEIRVIMANPSPIHYVDVDNPTPLPPYTSWSSAANDIQFAVDAAVDGDTILIADGTYKITSKINVMKSVTIGSVNGAEHVIVDASGNCRGFTLSSDSGVITLDGLTLTGGYANHAVTLGGAIFAYGNSDILITNCIVENNGSPGSAGGINLTANAGKHIKATVTSCLIRSNRAANNGGGIGINIKGSCQISIVDCTIEGNAAKNGGGVFCNAPNGWIDVSRCIIVSNTAVQVAGGIRCQRNVLLSDSLIIGNKAGQRGGGEHGGMVDTDSHILNCTIVDNEAPTGGGVSRATLFNSIVYGNRAATHPNITPDSVVALSCSPDLATGINGNLAADPQFVDPTSGDYRLLLTSPCVDAGTNAFVLSPSDLDGLTRIMDGNLDGNPVVDMGAYELQASVVSIDIKPGSATNPINLKSKGRCPVAILTTRDFDAMGIDPASARFAGAAPVHEMKEDVDGDGDLDLLLHFLTQDLRLSSSSTRAFLMGQTRDGQLLMGVDSIRIVPKK